MEKFNMLFIKQIIDKGMLSDERLLFVNDLKRYFAQNKNVSLQDLNIDMENLGWGIQIIDQPLYKELARHFGK